MKKYEDPYGKRSSVINLKTQADAPSYEVIGRARESYATSLIAGLKSKKQMVILREILGPPKAMQ